MMNPHFSPDMAKGGIVAIMTVTVGVVEAIPLDGWEKLGGMAVLAMTLWFIFGKIIPQLMKEKREETAANLATIRAIGQDHKEAVGRFSADHKEAVARFETTLREIQAETHTRDAIRDREFKEALRQFGAAISDANEKTSKALNEIASAIGENTVSKNRPDA